MTSRRWWQLIIGIVCMTMIANLQYGWTLFVPPLDAKFGWGRPAIQVAFTIFVLTETWLVPVEGYLVDRFGPRIIVAIAAVLVAASWVLNAFAASLAVLYLAAAIGGIGAGAVYGTCIGNALKWFPDRRGFAAGLTAMGFGAGSALTVIPIAAMIRSAGYDAAFLRVGIAQGAVILAFAWWLAAPPEGVAAVGAARAAGAAGAASGPRATGVERHYRPLEMARTPVFWVLYLMFVMMATGGLMVTAQLAPIAHDLRIADIPVSLLGITLPALTFALSIDRILNGITRPFFGWVSDWLGREHTMFAAFALEAAGILLLSRYGHNPVAFVLLSGLVFFAWGEIYSLFPATCGDTFGRRFASANAGLLYTAKGTAALLVPLSSLAAAAGGWKTVFAVAASLDATAAVLALVLLKPLRRSLGRAAAVRPPAHALDAPA